MVALVLLIIIVVNIVSYIDCLVIPTMSGSSSKLFSSFRFNDAKKVANRIVVAPMCQYSANDGLASDWHLTHWTNMLNSGAGMFIVEATAVRPDGRITPHCLGLYNDACEEAFRDKLTRAQALAPSEIQICLQLAHAGRKASSAVPWRGGQLLPRDDPASWQTVAPSAIPHSPHETPPHTLSITEIHTIRQDFVNTAKRAKRCGVHMLELHAAHGYLLHQFLSPIANQRTDAYGGSLINRMRLLLEIFDSVKDVFPDGVGVRVSGTDWMGSEGLQVEDVAEVASQLKRRGCDYLHVSSGGISPKQQIALRPNYQVPLAKFIKEQVGLPTIAVGLITDAQQAEDILQHGEADLVALARAFLYNPRWAWHAAVALEGKVHASPQYWRSLPREAKNIFHDLHLGQR